MTQVQENTTGSKVPLYTIVVRNGGDRVYVHVARPRPFQGITIGDDMEWSLEKWGTREG